MIVAESERRFSDNTELLYSLKSLQTNSKSFLDIHSLHPLIADNIDKSCLLKEINLFKNLVKDKSHDSISDTLTFLMDYKCVFSNIYTIKEVANTLGVSTASCEASFSTIERIMVPYR